MMRHKVNSAVTGVYHVQAPEHREDCQAAPAVHDVPEDYETPSPLHLYQPHTVSSASTFILSWQAI